MKSIKFTPWRNFTKLCFTVDMYKVLSEFPVETASPSKIRELEFFFATKLSNLDHVAKLSAKLYKLMIWFEGIVQ
jgi:hypothetical protein